MENCVQNLEWCTPAENNDHAIRTGLLPMETLRENIHKASLASAELTSIKCYCVETSEQFDSYSDAGRKTNTSASEIKNSCDNGSCVHGLHYARVGEQSTHVEIKDLPGEIWKDVPGYEGIYVISNLKRMRRLQGTCTTKTSTRTVPEKLIVTKYTNVSLNKDGKSEVVNFKNLWASVFDKQSKKLF